MVDIKLTISKNDYFIISDKTQWTFHEGINLNDKGEYAGKKNPHYFISINAMLVFIFDLALRKSDARTMEELLVEGKKINKELLRFESRIKKTVQG
jgi:hypothetical protein